MTDAEPPTPATDAKEAEIEAAARITNDDLDAAGADWRRHAPREFKTLLDAE